MNNNLFTFSTSYYPEYNQSGVGFYIFADVSTDGMLQFKYDRLPVGNLWLVLRNVQLDWGKDGGES